jgi:CysZ protein
MKGSEAVVDLIFVTRVFWRSLAAVRDPALWRLLVIPVVIAVGSLVVLLITALHPLSALFLEMAPATWLVRIGWTGVADIFAWVAAWLMLFAISYGLAALVSGLLIVSRLTDWLGRTSYSQLRRHGSDRLLKSALVSTVSTVVYLGGWLLTLPLWLVPGLAFVLPVGWLAWFNARTLSFDALTNYANDAELATIRLRFRGSFLVLGAVGALMAHIPIIGFFAASFTALMFAVAALEALSLIRGQTDGAGEIVEGEVIMSSAPKTTRESLR